MASSATLVSSSVPSTAPRSSGRTTASTVADNENKEIMIFEKKKPSSAWMRTLYNIKLFTPEDMKDIYEQFRYHGFDRDKILYQLEQITNDPKVAAEVIILCNMRGPQAASTIKLRNGKTPAQMQIPASGQQGTDGISCQRITAATADLGAYYLKIMDIPKRLPSLECPGWLQFPSAGSIKLPDILRKQHIEFSKQFSVVIGGVFNEQIYSQMMANAYLDEGLNLFN